MNETTRLLTETEASEILSVRPRTLAVWRVAKRYALPYVKVGRLVRYRESDLFAFLAARTVTPRRAGEVCNAR